LDLLDSGRGLHPQYGGYLVKVDLDSPLSDRISEEFFRSYSESTLLGVELYIEFSKERK